MNTDLENRREDFLDRHEGECVACKYYRELMEKMGKFRHRKGYCAYHNDYLEDVFECDEYVRG